MLDKEVENLIKLEKTRQQKVLELIPSENYVSKDVLTALGSEFTNKYSEGYPGHRYYGGQTNTDKLEQLAIDRAKKLFNADHANVQPHSGAQSNEAVYYAWCEPGDTILAMNLSHGGHLTHGASITQSAKMYNFIHYGVTDSRDAYIDYEKVRELALKHKPKIIMAGFSAYPRNLDFDLFSKIGKEVGALMVADMSHIAGLIVAGVCDNPFDFGFHVITTTTHKTLRGPRGGLVLSKGKVSNPLRKLEKTIENIPTLIDRAVFPGIQGGPHMNTIAAKAVCFYEASTNEYKEYIHQVVKNAKVLASEFVKNGVSLISGGTENHLMLIDTIKSFNIDGKEAEQRLDEIGLTVNANVLPFDTLPAYRPSGIRLGTPAITTKGYKEEDMKKIAKLIIDTLSKSN